MKTNLNIALMLILGVCQSYAQNNVQLVPAGGNVCNPMPISLDISGNSFTPVSYLWSTGETSEVIEIKNSGTYTLTVTGYMGNSNNLNTITKSATYNVLPAPTITALTDLWVCKGDTVKLAAVSGYSSINWSNGATGQLFQRKMVYNGPAVGPMLDTISINYTATLTNVCSVKSQTVILRAIRKPHGVGVAYQNKMNIKPTDSIPAGLVLEYLYPVKYEMSFTNLSNPSEVLTYTTAPGSRKMSAGLLTPGTMYSVVTTPIINNKRFCPGQAMTIGIAATSSNRLALGFTEEEGLKTFIIFDTQGRKLMEHQAEAFNKEWLNDIPSQILIIHRSGATNEIVKLQHVK